MRRGRWRRGVSGNSTAHRSMTSRIEPTSLTSVKTVNRGVRVKHSYHWPRGVLEEDLPPECTKEMKKMTGATAHEWRSRRDVTDDRGYLCHMCEQYNHLAQFNIMRTRAAGERTKRRKVATAVMSVYRCWQNKMPVMMKPCQFCNIVSLVGHVCHRHQGIGIHTHTAGRAID